MSRIVGEATSSAGTKRVMLTEALQDALEKAPPPSAADGIQKFRVLDVEFESGGIAGATVTRVSVEYTHSLELCEGSFKAHQIPGAVVIFATGSHPKAGYEVHLVKKQTDEFPPEYYLCHVPPTGDVAEVVTPFAVCASFTAPSTIDTVTVHDNTGDYDIVVEQVMKMGIESAPPVHAT